MKPARVAIYARVSTLDQARDGTSLDTQEAACRAHAAERGWEVVAAAREVFTGSELRGRPELSRLRELVRAGEVDVVLAYALDRLSRSQTHVAVLVEEMDAAGARLELVTETFEDTPIGRFIRAALAFKAELEREDLIERTTRGMRARASLGKLLGGIPPYGRRWDDAHERLLTDPVTGPILAEMSAWVLDGLPLREIARRLGDRGIPSPRGAQYWSVGTISRILRHPINCGRVYALRWEAVRKPGRKTRAITLRDSSDWLALPAGAVEPIVSEADWEEIQRRLESNRSMASRLNRYPDLGLLRGSARCGSCGASLHVLAKGSGGDGSPGYRCGRDHVRPTDPSARCTAPATIRASVLEPAVWSGFVRKLRNLIADVPPPTLADGPDTAVEASTIARELREVARTRDAWLDQLALLDAESQAELRGKLARLSERRRRLEGRRSELADADERAEARRAALRETIDWARERADELERLTTAERRDLLRRWRVRVEVFPAGRVPRWTATALLPAGGLRRDSPSGTDMPSSFDKAPICNSAGEPILISWAA